MKHPFLFFIGLSLLISCGGDEPDGPGGNGNGGNEKPVLKEYFGVNLSGAEFGISGDAPHGVDGTNYGYPTEQCLDYFDKKGLRLIRFPFRWERVQHELNGELDPDDLGKMKKFVEAAQSRDLPVILDMHNFCRRYTASGSLITIGQGAALKAEHLADVWIKLALEFKDYRNIWGYDIMNEPFNMPKKDTWFKTAQIVIDAIRTVDTETPIIISGDEYSSALRWPQVSDNLKDLVDPSDKLIYQAHIYFDADTSGNYAGSYDTDGATPQTGVQRVKPFVEWLKKNNKVGFVGEYGIPDNDAGWNEVLENMLQYLSDEGVTGTYWSAGPRWGDYKLSVQPTNNYTVDRPQMKVLEKFKKTNPKSN